MMRFGLARWRRNVSGVVAAAAVAAAVLPASAASGAVTAPRAPQAGDACTPQPGFTGCEAFGYTGAVQHFAVPPGTTEIDARAWGAGGGRSSGMGGGGGFAVTDDVQVTPGEDLSVVVGDAGNPASGIGGWGGGGLGGAYMSGGGMSAVVRTTPSEPFIIAGGGGGGSDIRGGDGGGRDGGNGSDPGQVGAGSGATGATGGAGGGTGSTKGGDYGHNGQDSADGRGGQIPIAGIGGGGGVRGKGGGCPGGGGGGGGYAGGGGGSSGTINTTCRAAGGGGGSSYFLSLSGGRGFTLAGSNGQAGGKGQFGYLAPAGNAGQPGRVVLQWNAVPVEPESVSVTPDGVSSGVQGASRVEAKVQVHNSGTVPVGVQTVTATAAEGFSWAEPKLYLWRHGQEEYDCTVDGQVLTCPDVPLNLQPGGDVWLYPWVSIAADAAVAEHDVPFSIGNPAIGEGAAKVEVLPALTQQVTVTADGKTTGQQGAPRVGAHVRVENTGTGFVGSQAVTVDAPAGFSFAGPAMYLWRDTAASTSAGTGMSAGPGGVPGRLGQEEYPCTVTAADTKMTCADVPLNLQPGQGVVLYPQLAVAEDARVGDHDVPFTVGDPGAPVGSGDAVVEVTAAPVPQVSVTATGDVTGAPEDVRGAEVIVQNTGVIGVGEDTVAVTAPAGWAFTQDVLHLWRESTNQAEEHPCVRSDQDRVLTCAGVPLNLAPGQWAVLFPQVQIAASATPGNHHVDYAIGQSPLIGTGRAVITVTGNTP